MAEAVKLGLVLEGEDAKRFIEYDDNKEVSDEVVAMFIKGKELYEKNKQKVRAIRELKSRR
jgi:hypothetical protein